MSHMRNVVLMDMKRKRKIKEDAVLHRSKLENGLTGAYRGTRQFKAASILLLPTRRKSLRTWTHTAVALPEACDVDMKSNNAGISIDLRCTRLQSRLVIHIL
jgi:hypothetical protein